MGSGIWALTGREFRNAALAFLASTFVAAVGLFLPSMVREGAASISRLSLAIVAYVYVVGVAGAFAFPLFLVLNRFRRLSWPAAVVAGAVAGFVTEALLLNQPTEVAVRAAAVGAASGLAFWVVWLYLRRHEC